MSRLLPKPKFIKPKFEIVRVCNVYFSENKNLPVRKAELFAFLKRFSLKEMFQAPTIQNLGLMNIRLR